MCKGADITILEDIIPASILDVVLTRLSKAWRCYSDEKPHKNQESTSQTSHVYLAVEKEVTPIPCKIVIGIESHEDIGLSDGGTLLEPRL